MPKIQIKNLNKTYGAKLNQGSTQSDSTGVEVLRNISLTIESGEKIALVGASGSGKSTFLNLLGALDRPTSGEVIYDGVSLFTKTDIELAQFRNNKVGFIFQFHHLLPEFTALENVMMPSLINGKSEAEVKEDMEEILINVGLKDRIHHKPGELSGGEQQRVAVARALSLKPELLLADEPTGNLDSKTGFEVFKLMSELNEKLKTTLIMVTHNLELADTFPKKLLMKDGTIV